MDSQGSATPPPRCKNRTPGRLVVNVEGGLSAFLPSVREGQHNPHRAGRHDRPNSLQGRHSKSVKRDTLVLIPWGDGEYSELAQRFVCHNP